MESNNVSRDHDQTAGSALEWQTFWNAPLDGTHVWTFGSLHFDGTGETPRIQRSWYDREFKCWVSDEWGSHEPHFWAPISSAKPLDGD